MTLAVGIEVPDADLAVRLGTGLDDLPRLLDASGAAYAVLGADRAARTGEPSASPTVVGTFLARRTTGVGIVVAASPQRDHPYNAARRVASLDHVSGGRAGLLALRRDRSLELGIGGRSTWAPGELTAAHLADALTATRKLWRTWPLESLDSDPEVALAARLPFADHTGVFATKGPLNVPTTPQGEPVVFWPASPAGPLSQDEVELAAVSADVIIVDDDVLARESALLAGAVQAGAAAGRPVRVHVRVRLAASAGPVSAERPDASVTETVLSLGDARPYVSGIVFRVPAADLPRLAGDVLPRLAGSGAVRLRPGTPETPSHPVTLRDLLAIPRRAEPDLSANPAAFPVASKEPA